MDEQIGSDGMLKSDAASGPAPSGDGEDLTPEESMKKEIRGWAWGLLIIGGLSIYFDAVWGAILITGGIAGFFIRHRAAFIVFGSTVLFAGVSNLVTLTSSGIVFAVIQALVAFGEFKKYREYANVPLSAGGAPQEPVERSSNYSGRGLASVVLAGVAGVCCITYVTWILVTASQAPVQLDAAQGVWRIVGSLLFTGWGLAAFIGTGLGIAAIAQKRHHRLLGFIGLGGNALWCLLFAMLMALPLLGSL